MLILARKQGQKIIINDSIVITVLDSESGLAKIGIDAPQGVKIYREEIYNAVKNANLEANRSTKTSFDELKALAIVNRKNEI